jgi:hypothetical protein
MSKVPITTSATLCNQMRYPTDRWYPYRRSRLGGFRMIRTATRKRDRRQQRQQVLCPGPFINWESPSTRPTRVTTTTRNPIVIHPNRMARRSVPACFRGSSVRPNARSFTILAEKEFPHTRSPSPGSSRGQQESSAPRPADRRTCLTVEAGSAATCLQTSQLLLRQAGTGRCSPTEVVDGQLGAAQRRPLTTLAG